MTKYREHAVRSAKYIEKTGHKLDIKKNSPSDAGHFEINRHETLEKIIEKFYREVPDIMSR
jgi:hypothetical protein